jgi:hypothetical protein
LIAVELAVGAGLLTDHVREAAIAAGGLLLVLTLVLGVELARGARHDCGCFGSEQRRPIGWSLVVQDLVLLLMAAFVGLNAQDGIGSAIGLVEEPLIAPLAGVATLLVLLGWGEFDATRAAFEEWQEATAAALPDVASQDATRRPV